MREEEIDRKIKAALSQHIELSHTYQNMVRTTLQEQKKKKKTRIKAIKTFATSCACVLVITSIVYAKDISNWVQNFFNDSKGIDTAIENGYIANPNMEYINLNGTEAKIENFLMDDYNLSFTLDLKFDENVNVNEITRISIPDIIITDEENRILYCENKDSFDKFCEKNNIYYEYNNFNENYIDSGSNWYIKNKDENTNRVEFIYNLQGGKYPKSKKILVNFTSINMSMSKQEFSEKKEIFMAGNWNLNLDVPEQFYNREEIVFAVKNCNDNSIYIDEFSVKDTGTRFSFHTKLEEIYYETDTEEVKKQKNEEMSRWYFNEIKNGRYFIINEYIEDENGNKYYPSIPSTENSKTSYLMSGDFTHYQTFSLTKYNITNKMKIYFTLNLPNETKDIIIELERNSQ